jgi:hypothetical protein
MGCAVVPEQARCYSMPSKRRGVSRSRRLRGTAFERLGYGPSRSSSAATRSRRSARRDREGPRHVHRVVAERVAGIQELRCGCAIHERVVRRQEQLGRELSERRDGRR